MGARGIGWAALSALCIAACGGDDGGLAIDAAPFGIACGAATCTTGQVCCDQPGSPVGMLSCIPQGGACPSGVILACDGPEDCASHECCHAGSGATCTDPASGSMCPMRLCHGPGDCATDETCCPAAPLGPSVCMATVGAACVR